MFDPSKQEIAIFIPKQKCDCIIIKVTLLLAVLQARMDVLLTPKVASNVKDFQITETAPSAHVCRMKAAKNATIIIL